MADPHPLICLPISLTAESPDRLLSQEWLVGNGLGGFASGTLPGVNTRRYHGLLVAALPAPLGRAVMLAHVGERLWLSDGRCVDLCGEETAGRAPVLPDALFEFRLELGLPVWRYRCGDTVLDKRVLLPHGQNSVHIHYELVAGPGARLELEPRLHLRALEAPVAAEPGDYLLQVQGERAEVHPAAGDAFPPLRLRVLGRPAHLVLDGGRVIPQHLRLEAARGYPAQGALWSPGRFGVTLGTQQACALVASTESWETLQAQPPGEALQVERERRERLLAQADPRARHGLAADLVLAADAFIVAPSGRQADAARAQAEGEQARTVIAGYHWFTDWGRDTMISLEGLALATGRHAEAAWVLRTFAHHVKDGLIPNLFPDGANEGLYHTADATLWFFHAIDRYLAASGDRSLLERTLPVLRDIVRHHLRGTRFGIGVDPADGLLTQGAPGYQLTWMDAKVDGWVVTPRRGKAVELNALLHNALRLMQQWLEQAGDGGGAQEMEHHATRLCTSFNQRFWNPATGGLFDVVDGEQGDDPAIRPNMLLAIALPHPVLEPSRWASVMAVARRELLTPVGLRSLAPAHPAYQARYDGDLRARDAAYHQGTVWGWLAGPFADAWLKAHPQDPAPVQHLLRGFEQHLRQEAGIGFISEIFDAEAPYTARGCIAQAWSVAEALRLALRFAKAEA
ncbi:glycogen debranching enzyme family protein [Ramlibacter sp. AW1]|uniref:Glycogen debranching enzyme family protein n=1 Tax=Ramlibacter aurantiacus TaxID=2801330 RepID=A0A937D3L9_9BURK|nr:amylo-alpha-1,6-glucosidase [Ramlibacter aurantiacus]MBL0422824.1 glycogen debranching enzyme family protein [Ramlibacter aurantiacus]